MKNERTRKEDSSPKKPASIAYDDIRVGDRATFNTKVTEDMISQFADLTGDRNPLHLDELWAQEAMYRGRVAHGMLLAGFFSRLVGMHMPGMHCIYLSQNCKFLLPIRPGTMVTVVGEVIQKSESSRTLRLRTQVCDENGKVAVDGTAEVMVMTQSKRGEMMLDKVDLDLSGKVVLITGASKGIGAQTAVLLAKHKASVAVNFCRSVDRAGQIIHEIKSFGGEAMPVQADVSNLEQVNSMVKSVRERYGDVDILVNNAGPPIEPKPFRETGWEKWQNDLDVIIRGTHNCIMAVLDGMVTRKSGRIINVITTAALGGPPAHLSSYVTAKTGLLGLSKALAVELGPIGINVNMVAPGLTDTEMISYLPPRHRDLIAHQTPLRRIANPADVGKVVLFLASSASDFINGAVIPVCGGHTMI